MLISFVRSGLAVRTQGRRPAELEARVGSEELLSDAESLLEYLVTYESTSERLIESGQTVAYGGWLVRLRQQDGSLIVEALDMESDEAYDETVDVAIEFMREQRSACMHCGADFAPPRVHHLVAVSDAVLAGTSDVEGVRFPDRDDRSGWILSEIGFAGSVRDLKVIHAAHLVRRCRAVAGLLALPAGFRIRVVDGEYDAWFDPKVATASTL